MIVAGQGTPRNGGTPLHRPGPPFCPDRQLVVLGAADGGASVRWATTDARVTAAGDSRSANGTARSDPVMIPGGAPRIGRNPNAAVSATAATAPSSAHTRYDQPPATDPSSRADRHPDTHDGRQQQQQGQQR